MTAHKLVCGLGLEIGCHDSPCRQETIAGGKLAPKGA